MEDWADEQMEPDPELNRWTNQIIGAAIDVHRELGPSHCELILFSLPAPSVPAVASVPFVDTRQQEGP